MKANFEHMKWEAQQHAEREARQAEARETIADEIHALRDQLAAAKRDTERLDWLECELQREMALVNVSQPQLSLFRRNAPITRAAIDAAIAQEPRT